MIYSTFFLYKNEIGKIVRNSDEISQSEPGYVTPSTLSVEQTDPVMQTYLTGHDQQREAESAAMAKNAEDILMELYSSLQRSDKKWKYTRTSKTCGAKVYERKNRGVSNFISHNYQIQRNSQKYRCG